MRSTNPQRRRPDYPGSIWTGRDRAKARALDADHAARFGWAERQGFDLRPALARHDSKSADVVIKKGVHPFCNRVPRFGGTIYGD